MARKTPPAKLPSTKPKASAIYRLNPSQRRFVLNLKSTNFNQTEAYMSAYGTVDKDSAAQSASRLMNDPDVMEAISDIVKEADIFATESLEKIASRFVKLAEESGRESDRIRANELLAKIHPEKFLDDRQQTAVIIADGGELAAIRESMRAAGKLIDAPIKPAIITTNELTVEPIEPKSTNSNDPSSTQDADSIDVK